MGNLRISRDLRLFKTQARTSKFNSDFEFDRGVKVVSDFYESAGVASGHYFHQDLFVATEIFHSNPETHHDIGSRIDGFISHLAVFRKVEVFDIRNLSSTNPNIEFTTLDIMDTKMVAAMNKVSSLSCLHTAEHFGLGRYGDPIDFDGWLTGLKNMTELLEQGGTFYFSTPISNRQRIVFNAHRIFHPRFLTNHFGSDFEIIKTVAVRDSGSLDLNADFQSDNFYLDFMDDYACGIWILRKK